MKKSLIVKKKKKELSELTFKTGVEVNEAVTCKVSSQSDVV